MRCDGNRKEINHRIKGGGRKKELKQDISKFNIE